MSRDASDVDGPNGDKLGVNTTWVAGAASTGNLNITLVHEPVTTDDSNNFGGVGEQQTLYKGNNMNINSKKEANDANNFRPITILNEFARIMD